MKPKYAIIQNKKIYYKITGKGKPVVLVHGFAEDSDVWKYQQDELAKHFQLIIPDLPGSGHSEMTEDMSIEGMAASIYQLLLNESLQLPSPARVIMIGHSMGGYITLAFAEKHPEMLEAFGLFHSTAYADTAEKKNARQRGIAFIRTHGSYEFLQQSVPNLFSDIYRTRNSNAVKNMIEQYKNFEPVALAAYYAAMIERPDRTAVLKSFNKPVLFIAGKNDKAIPFEDSMQQCHLPQLSYIHILENTAHMGMWEEPEKATSALASFLQDVYVI
jgi:pimeloyl-ACP methyl ester carboxylesterase